MSSPVKAPKKKTKKKAPAQTTLSSSVSPSLLNSSASHQQHHSAPPPQSQQSKVGLQSINENVEYSPAAEQQPQSDLTHPRFPRSSTVPYPAYATLRKGGGSRPAPQYYYTDYPAFIHGTVSPAQVHNYFTTRQPFASINSNFQPISPHHQQYPQRPVDILKPTFLIVSKEAEQQLSSQLTTSASPVPPGGAASTSKTFSKPTTKKTEGKSQEKSPTAMDQSSPTSRNAEVQTHNESPTRATTVDNVYPHPAGHMVTSTPSPYVHFVNVAYSGPSPQFFQDGPPETSILQEDFIAINDYHQPSTSIRSMPNIALAQGRHREGKYLLVRLAEEKCMF